MWVTRFEKFSIGREQCDSAASHERLANEYESPVAGNYPTIIKRRKTTNMNKSLILINCMAVCAAFPNLCRAQSDAPYTEGPVWTITMVKAKPGMTDDYLKTQTKNFKTFNDEAKKQGIVVDYKILLGDASSPHDFDILLMTEFKNMAAFDGMRAKLDPIADKLIGSEDVQREGAVKRMEIREIMGDKLMREITLK